MKPVNPIRGMEEEEVTYAKDQPEYIPLPTLKSSVPDGKGKVIMRWEFTDDERKAIANGADLYLEVLTFHQPLQPLRPFICWDNEELLKYFLENFR
jgi:hypothetical protein